MQNIYTGNGSIEEDLVGQTLRQSRIAQIRSYLLTKSKVGNLC